MGVSKPKVVHVGPRVALIFYVQRCVDSPQRSLRFTAIVENAGPQAGGTNIKSIELVASHVDHQSRTVEWSEHVNAVSNVDEPSRAEPEQLSTETQHQIRRLIRKRVDFDEALEQVERILIDRRRFFDTNGPCRDQLREPPQAANMNIGVRQSSHPQKRIAGISIPFERLVGLRTKPDLEPEGQMHRRSVALVERNILERRPPRGAARARFPKEPVVLVITKRADRRGLRSWRRHGGCTDAP